MLYTNLNHIETAAEYSRIISNNQNVVLICGRMGNKCIPVYRIAEALESKYKHVKFFDIEYDNPESQVVRDLPEVKPIQDIPYIVFYKNGKVVQSSGSSQTKEEIALTIENIYRSSKTI